MSALLKLAALMCVVTCATAQTVDLRVFDAGNIEIVSLRQLGISSGSDVTINFGATPVSSLMQIRIYDHDSIGNNLPLNASIGKLTILGSAVSTGRINLLIGDGDQFLPIAPVNSQFAFPQLAADANNLNPGLVNFGGSIDGLTLDASGKAHDYDADPWGTSNNGPSAGLYGVNPPFAVNNQLRGLIIPDPTLRRQTVVAIVVSNDICPGYDPALNGPSPAGRIEAGHILRVAALGTASGNTVSGGTINAHIIADARDTYLSYADLNNPPHPPNIPGTIAPTTTGFKAIETISAG